MEHSRRLISLLCMSLLAGTGCQQLGVSVATRSGSATVVEEVPRAFSSGDGACNVVVAYYSLSGNTEQMARAVEEGARQVEGVTAIAKPIAEVTRADLDAARGLILGCPTHFANIPAEMKAAIDHWAWKERVDLTDKVGGAFATGGNVTGGKEHVVISLLLYMLNNRMIVVGPIHKEGEGGYGEIGASATTGSADPRLNEDELLAATRLGLRVAQVVRSLCSP